MILILIYIVGLVIFVTLLSLSFLMFLIEVLKSSPTVCIRHNIKLKTHGYYDEKYCPKCWTEMIKEATKR